MTRGSYVHPLRTAAHFGARKRPSRGVARPRRSRTPPSTVTEWTPMASAELHESHVIRDGHNAEDGRPHSSAIGRDLATGFIEFLVRRLETHAAFSWCGGPTHGIHRLVRVRFRKPALPQ